MSTAIANADAEPTRKSRCGPSHRIQGRMGEGAQEAADARKGADAPRDQIAAERRALPWVRIDKSYVFDTPEGRRTLADLFDGRSQLLVQHFMLAPGWEEGCASCSYMADHSDGMIVHLAHRDITFIAVSARRWPKSSASAGAWAGSSIGCRRTATTSTMISA